MRIAVGLPASSIFDTARLDQRRGAGCARAQGDPGRLWIVAGEQAQGRGRQGRVWASPPGNLYASLLLVDPCAAGDLAAARLRRRRSAPRAPWLTSPGIAAPRLALKWPNDLLLDGAKLAGILVEGTTLPGGGPLAVVIGIGVNVAPSPGGHALSGQPICARSGFDRAARSGLRGAGRRNGR